MAFGLMLFCSSSWAWETLINGTVTRSRDEARAVTVDGNGGVVAAGFTENVGSGNDFTVVKFDGTSGAELWRQVINGTANGNDQALAVTVDALANVVAAGFSTNTDTGDDFTVVKFDGVSGAELWRQVINGTILTGSDVALAVTVDGWGNVIAAGRTANTGTGGDFTVIKFDGVSGAELWRQVINGTGIAPFDVALAVAVDGNGDVIAAGSTQHIGNPADFTVVKFDGVSGAELWRQVINGTGIAPIDEARTVIVDSAGDVVAAGFITNIGTGSDFFTVIKFDGTSGAELWRQEINGTAGFGNVANAVAVDAAGNVVAAGRTANTGTLHDFTVIKFDGASGAELWRQIFDGGGGTENRIDEARAVTVDAAGDVLAAGSIRRANDFRDLRADFIVVKFDGGSGSELWRQVFDTIVANSVDVANATAVDGAGNVLAAGFIGGFVSDFIVVKFDGGSGSELWRQVINSIANASDQANAVATDAAGGVVAAGFTENSGTGRDFTVVKFDGVSGAELWRQVINGTANASDQANGVAVDGAGDVVAAGFTENSATGRDFTVVKFDGVSGSELWRQVIDGTRNGTDEALAVTVDAAGDVVAAGFTLSTGVIGSAFTVIKFDGVSGQELWRTLISASGGEARAVRVDANGDVVAAGVTVNVGTQDDFTVVKFDGMSGAELWRKLIIGTSGGIGEGARAITLDPDGNVVAAGLTNNAGTSFDFTVVKLARENGQELWRQLVNGTSNRFDEARAVAVDNAGNVVAAGFTENEAPFTRRFFTVVKFDGFSGAELWRQLILDGDAHAVAVDAAQDVVAAGETLNTATLNDFTLVKFDGVSGAEIWSREVNGTRLPFSFDEARAVTVDGEGNVVATGFTENISASRDFTVVKLRGTDGGDFVPPAVLAVSPTVITAGGTVTATWIGITIPTSTDWIGLYVPGASNTDFIDWIYISCSKTPGSAQASGSCPFVVPASLAPGTYELRLFANDGFTLLATSNAFTVVNSASVAR
jgi:uncharacterized delta-60 repeat protein